MIRMHNPEGILSAMLERHPALAPCEADILRGYDLLYAGFRRGGKLLLCGNGGSAADCGHIAGELMKGFVLKRPVPPGHKARLRQASGGDYLPDRLQQGLPAIPLPGLCAFNTAVANDTAPDVVYAQAVYALGNEGDLLWALSTSGNAANVCHALATAQALGLQTLGLTGQAGGRMAALCDVCIRVPEIETYIIQEYHLPIYHALCAMLEAAFYG